MNHLKVIDVLHYCTSKQQEIYSLKPPYIFVAKPIYKIKTVHLHLILKDLWQMQRKQI